MLAVYLFSPNVSSLSLIPDILLMQIKSIRGLNISVHKRLPSPISVIMSCSPIREAVRAATLYYTRDLQTLKHGKVIVIYIPF